MTTIRVDSETLAGLTGAKELVAVSDAAGVVVGYFAPVGQEYAEEYAEMAARAASVWGPDGPPRRSMTTAEVIAQLETREQAR